MVHQRDTVWLEVHPLAHADVGERVAGLESEFQVPVEDIAIGPAIDGADDVVGAALIAVGIQARDMPGAMLAGWRPPGCPAR